MTPLHIEIMLHHYSRTNDYGIEDGRYNAPAVREYREWLVRQGMLTPLVGGGFPHYHEITEMGRAYIAALLRVELPVCKYVVPNVTEATHD